MNPEELAHDQNAIAEINGQPYCNACARNGEPFPWQEGPQAHLLTNE